MLLSIKHPQIVKLIDFHEETKNNKIKRYIIIEFVKNKELFKYLKAGGALPEPIVKFYFN